ncbi:MAG: DUF1002 domain-containing protein [Prevotellaceae bacterium]|nr:DUF1002 domain-containing protein [Prevotellaceae bacterium]
MDREAVEECVKELEKQLSDQRQQIATLMEQIEQQEKELSFYRNRKDSSNSSLSFPKIRFASVGQKVYENPRAKSRAVKWVIRGKRWKCMRKRHP